MRVKDFDEYTADERARMAWRAIFGGVDENGERVPGLKDESRAVRRMLRLVGIAITIVVAHTFGLPTDHVARILSAVAQAHGLQ